MATTPVKVSLYAFRAVVKCMWCEASIEIPARPFSSALYWPMRRAPERQRFIQELYYLFVDVPPPKTWIIFRKKDCAELDIAACFQRIEYWDAAGSDDRGEDAKTARHSVASR